MALTAAGSALVAGSTQENHMQLQVTKVRVVRAFYFDKKPTTVGTVVELPKIFASEMIAAKKAEPHDPNSDAKEALESKKLDPRGGKLV
jgi:hypothetical protein